MISQFSLFRLILLHESSFLHLCTFCKTLNQGYYVIKLESKILCSLIVLILIINNKNNNIREQQNSSFFILQYTVRIKHNIKEKKYLENKVKELNKDLKNMTLDEMDVYWEEAKEMLKS